MSWKDNWREEYEDSDLSWDEFHGQKFVHVDEIADTKLEDLKDQVEAMTREYRGLKREFHELKVMLESDEFDP